MITYLVITKLPIRPSLLGPIPEHVSIKEIEADNIESLKEKLDVPIYGECFIAKKDDVTILFPKIIYVKKDN